MGTLRELQELRAEAFSFAQAEARDRHLRATGRPPQESLRARVKAHPRLCSRDGVQEVQDALSRALERAKSDDGASGQGRVARLSGLRELVVRARAQALEPQAAQELLDFDLHPSVRPPGDRGLHGALPPLLVRTELPLERSRTRRFELESALADASSRLDDARTATFDAGATALGELNLGDPLAAALALHARGFSPPPKDVTLLTHVERTAQHVLDATDPIARDLGAFFLERITQARPHPGDASLHDLLHLIHAPPCASAFIRGELLRTVRRFAEGLRLDLSGGSHVKLDELDPQERPHAWPLASAHGVDVPYQARVALLPQEGPRALAALLAAVAESQRMTGPSSEAPPEDSWTCDPAVAFANGDVFAALARTPGFLTRLAKTELHRDDERTLALADLFATRTAAARTLASIEAFRLGLSARTASVHQDLFARAALCTLPSGLALEGLDPWLTSFAELRGRMLAARIRAFFVERFDEDWFRNPRVLASLGSLWVRGGRPQVNELWSEVAPGEVPSAEALVRDLTHACA
ncbi:MAG: hypothetical protein JST92_01745 [Deltaproteobacteria bacterium]|nr:hypothetical protein [Deltaproteobacteria bacterium]